MRLVDEGMLELATPARSLLGDDLPLVGDDVTVEHLLAHRSGIGDYLDEDTDVDVDEYLMPVPVHELATSEQYLAVLDGHAPKFAPGEGFSYCNSGYVLLALLAERASGVPFHELVLEHVCGPRGWPTRPSCARTSCRAEPRSGTSRSTGRRTNVLHLPVRGSGDGGILDRGRHSGALERSLRGEDRVARPRRRDDQAAGRDADRSRRYGLGFWLHPAGDLVVLEGMDAGVSFRTVHDPGSTVTHTVISNTTDGAWPLARSSSRRSAAEPGARRACNSLLLARVACFLARVGLTSPHDATRDR